MNTYTTVFFSDARAFIKNLPDTDKAKIFAAIKTMETSFEAVYTKPLRGPIKELIVKKYRLLFFLKHNTIYIITGFVKKTKKTPKNEIEYVENIYKRMK